MPSNVQITPYCGSDAMSPLGTKRRLKLGQSMSVLLGTSDINLFRYCHGVIHFDAQVSDRAFDLGMVKEKLNGPEISGPPGDQGSLCALQLPDSLASHPALPTHDETRRAYWRIVILVWGARRPEKRNSPGLLLRAFN